MHRYAEGTLITGSARLSRQLRQAYDVARNREGQRVWETPDILSHDAWIRRAWREHVHGNPLDSPLLLNSTQTKELWERAIEASESDPASILLDRPATVSAATRAWDLLHAWEAHFDPAVFAQTADPAAFANWKQIVDRELRENGWITAGQLPGEIARRIESGRLKIAGPLAYTGFDEMTPAERRLLAASSASERAVPEPFETAARSRIACLSAEDELAHAAQWARRTLEARPDARIGIVVRDLAGQAAAIDRVFDDILQPGLAFTSSTTRSIFDVSLGSRLADTPLIGTALLALHLGTGLTLPEAEMLLRSPFLGLPRAEGAGVAAALRKQGADRISFQNELVRRTFPRFAKATAESAQWQRPSQWSAAFSKFLMRAGWPGLRELSPSEIQVLEEWKTLLSELASLDLLKTRMDYPEALARLQQIARQRRLRSHDADAPVQVMDTGEAAGTRWDALWIAGLDAGAWPEVPRPNPFLPLALQRAAGMPDSSPERKLEDARRMTTALLAAAPEIVCSYARFAGEEQLRVSPLIEALPERSPDAAPFETILRRAFVAGASMEVQPPDQAPPLPPGTSQQGGMSVLKNQAACPFRAFAVHRLRAREADAADLGISLAERGTVAHKALELLWLELKTQKSLLASSQRDLSNLISRCVKDALDGRLGRREGSRSLTRARSLEQARWEKLLQAWLEVEKTRPEFEVVESEKSREVGVGGLKLQIKADRIDRLEDETLAILDYKTSDKLDVKDWDGERPDAPQLPLYAVKSDPKPAAVYFATLALSKTAMSGHWGAELARRMKEWEPVVDELGRSFLRGDAAVDPKHPVKSCQFCHLHLLCRVGELQMNSLAAGEEASE